MRHFIQQLNGTSALGNLSIDTKRAIRKNSKEISDVLKRANRLNGLGAENDIITTNEFISDKRYNPNISNDEIQAWVYYKRSLGVPMRGWEKFFISGNGGNTTNVTAISDTELRDCNFISIGISPKGSFLGTLIEGKEFNSSSEESSFIYFTDKAGKIRCTQKNNVRLTKSTFTADKNEIDRLVNGGCLFYNQGRYLPFAIYTYGNSYDRELQLNDDKDFIIKKYGKAVFDNHEKVIKESRPKQLSFLDPVSENRPQLSPISVYARNFEIEGLEGYEGRENEIWKGRDESGYGLGFITLASAYEWWLNENRKDVALFEKSVGSYEIIKYYLRGDNIPRKRLGEEVAQKIEKDSRAEGERLFGVFIEKIVRYRDKQRLDIDWNRKYNAFPNLRYDKIPIGFSANSKFKGGDFEIRPAQREGVAFMEMINSGCISFDVGVGKTITAISELAMALQEGKCQKPIVVVPNSTYRNWISEILGTEDCTGVLFGTGVTINDWYNLGTGVKYSIKDVQPNTITIVTYEGFGKLGFSDSVSDELCEEMKHILLQDVNAVKPKTALKVMQRIEESIGKGNKGTVLNFDECGFDYIVYDEAHNAKNVFCSVTTQGQQKKFNQQSGGEPSARGLKLFLLANYTQRKFGGNVMLLTATPFTNSPLEIYSMLTIVGYQDLTEAGYRNIEEFCETFIEEQKESVVNAAGDIVDADVVKKFRNRIILQQLIYNHFNYKTGEEAGVKRPTKVNLPRLYLESKRLNNKDQILTYLKLNEEQQENQEEINEKIDKGLNAHSKDDLKNLLRGLSESLNNALSPFLYTHEIPQDYNDFVERSPKIKYACDCIESVKKFHEDNGEECSGQIIFSNRGATYFSYIKDYLINIVGFKRGLSVSWSKKKFDEVEIMNSETCSTVDKKDDYMRAFNEGIIKVIIGTATIREGVNLQKRSTVLYNLYPDWNPTNIQQLEGRIWRQGNKNQYVRIVLPLMQNSMDTFVFQKIEEKTSRINDIWYRGDRGNVLNVDSLDPDEVKYALVTDVNKLAKVKIDGEKVQYNRDVLVCKQKIDELKDFAYKNERLKTSRERVLKAMRDTIQNAENYNDIISLRPTKEQLDKLDKEKREKIVKTLEMFDECKAFLQKSSFDDKEILKMSRKFEHFSAYTSWYATEMSEMVSTIAKAERSILEPKGYTRNDDISKVTESYQKDMQKAQEEYDFLSSPEHYDTIYEEIVQKKKEMNVVGKSLDERVDEFKSTNYILSIPFDPNKELPNNSLPNQDDVKQSDNGNDDELKQKRAKALMLKMKMAKAKIKLIDGLEGAETEHEKKIAQFIMEIGGRELTNEESDIYEAFTETDSVKTIQMTDLLGMFNILKIVAHNYEFGSKHILIKHFGVKQDYVTAGEIVKIGDIIKSVEPHVEEGGKRHIYECVKNNIRYRVVIDINRKSKTGVLITFYTNRQ